MTGAASTPEHRCDVCVIGDSPTALAAALDFAEVGLAVTVVTPGDNAADWPTGYVNDDDTAVTTLIDRIATAVNPDNPDHDELRPIVRDDIRELVAGRNGDIDAVPEPNILGIPAVPLDAHVLRLLGTGGAFRAFVDRIAPVLKIGKEANLWHLVTKRLGSGLAETLVRPHLAARFGVAADQIDTAVAAPGLNEATSRAGSLTGGVLALSDRWHEREATVAPGAGWNALRDAAFARLALYRSTVLTGTLTRGGGSAPAGAADRAGAAEHASAADHSDSGHSDSGHSDSGHSDPEWTITITGPTSSPGSTTEPSSTAEPGAPVKPGSSSSTTEPAATETVITARALVLDRGACSPDALPHDAELATAWQRTILTAPVTAEGLTPANGDAALNGPAELTLDRVAGLPENAAIQVATEGSRTVARVLLPREPVSTGGGSVARATQHDILAAATQALDERGVRVDPHTNWRVCALAAPYVSLREAHAARDRLATAHAEHPNLLLTGAARHGGHLARALTAVGELTQPLRRVLTGIAP